MEINIELTEEDLRNLITIYLQNKLGDTPIDINKVKIQVKSKQNFRSEWEESAFKATYRGYIK